MDCAFLKQKMLADTLDSFYEELEQELGDENFLTDAIDPTRNEEQLRYFRELFLTSRRADQAAGMGCKEQAESGRAVRRT